MPPLAALGAILAGTSAAGATGAVAAWGAIGAGVKAGADLYGAHESASATEQAAQTQANAVEQGQQLQAQAAAQALAFQKQQAEANYQQQEQALQANYNQWVASRGGAQTMRSLLGLPALNIPAFVPMADPNFTGTAPGAGGTSNATGKGGVPLVADPMGTGSITQGNAPVSPTTPGSPTAPAPTTTTGGYSFAIPPGMNPSNPVDKLVLDQFQAGVKAGKTDPGSQPTAANMAYWQQQINATGGATPSNLAYWTTKMSAGASGAPSASAPTSGNSLASYLGTVPSPVTPNNPYLIPTAPPVALNG